LKQKHDSVIVFCITAPTHFFDTDSLASACLHALARLSAEKKMPKAGFCERMKLFFARTDKKVLLQFYAFSILLHVSLRQ
jgi:hypothetical protein